MVNYHPTSPSGRGVPQGSILGPLLYIIYDNDISSLFKNCKSILYADDTVIYKQGIELNSLKVALQEDLQNLEGWCKLNGLFVNPKKTKYMIFGSRTKLAKMGDIELTIDKVALDRANSYTYLGITLDEQLNYEKFANSIISRVSDKIYQLRRLRQFLNTRAALLIYKNMILPILEYGDVFISSMTLDTRKKIQTLQNRGLKCALSKDRLFNTDLLHSEAKIKKLKWR